MTRRIYLDSSVLIAITEGEPEVAAAALEILDDQNHPVAIVLSEAVRLEVVPARARDPKKAPQIPVIEQIFARAVDVVTCFDGPVWQAALDEAEKYWLQALDALHVAAARTARVDELLTAESPRKSICQTKSLKVRSLRKS